MHEYQLMGYLMHINITTKLWKYHTTMTTRLASKEDTSLLHDYKSPNILNHFENKQLI